MILTPAKMIQAVVRAELPRARRPAVYRKNRTRDLWDLYHFDGLMALAALFTRRFV